MPPAGSGKGDEVDVEERLDLGEDVHTTPDTTSVRSRRRQDTRDRLLRVASELFSRAGYEQTTYDDIAREAGVSRQTVFNHFPHKGDFAFEWGIRNRRQLHELIATEGFQSQSATSQLVMIMRAMADEYDSSATQARVLVEAWVKAGGPILEKAELLGSIFESVIRSGQQSGEFRADVNATQAGGLIRAAYFDALYQWIAAEGRDDRPDLFSSWIERLELILTVLRLPPLVTLRSLAASTSVPPRR